jgi:hypothetical protein
MPDTVLQCGGREEEEENNNDDALDHKSKQ